LGETKDGGRELDGYLTVGQKASEMEEPADGCMWKRDSGSTKDLEADAAEELGPGVTYEQHFADGVHQTDVLDHQARLVDALEICQRGKAEASKGLATEDNFSASLLTEAHLGYECVVRIDGNPVELVGVQWPGSKCIAYPGEPDMPVALRASFRVMKL
jgi:hypothetical protein